jgi:uncharacterized protein (TIGR03084 family)
MSTGIFDDLQAEHAALDEVLASLPEATWSAPSAAVGWTIADVVVHLAQTDEAVVAAVAGGTEALDWRRHGDTVDEAMAALVRAERATPAEALHRWRTAREAALAALRRADPGQPVQWVAAPLKPRTLATTRLAECWAHALDITVGVGVPYPDTARIRHIAWLGYSTLPYAFALVGEPPHEVYCELTAPDGTTWRYGRPDAQSTVAGPAGAFCRVGAQRLSPERSGLVTGGPHGPTALRVLRNYAGRLLM